MQAAIYQFTNKISGKIYIGQSIDIVSRFRTHIRHTHNNYLFSDINNYGIECFKFEVLEFISNDTNKLKSSLNEREQFYIDSEDSLKLFLKEIKSMSKKEQREYFNIHRIGVNEIKFKNRENF